MEMLLQSHEGELNLLPACPDAWPEGRVAGLRARGGFEIDMKWAGGHLTEAVIRSDLGNGCRIRSDLPIEVFSEGTRLKSRFDNGLVVFETTAGGKYTVRPGQEITPAESES